MQQGVQTTFGQSGFRGELACCLTGAGARLDLDLKALPQLRVMVTALVNSMDSINFVCILMFLVYYIFAIFGMMLFKTNDPWHFRKGSQYPPDLHNRS